MCHVDICCRGGIYSSGGCEVASTLYMYVLRKGDLFVLNCMGKGVTYTRVTGKFMVHACREWDRRCAFCLVCEAWRCKCSFM